ncbi:MAG: alpha/beta hydrolase family protein, partial [Candidatus Hodarchaeota archaeon]
MQKLKLTIVLAILIFYIGSQEKLRHAKAFPSSPSFFSAKNTNSSELPDFWPDKEAIADTSSLNIEWFPEEDTNRTFPLKQRHLYYNSQPNVRIHGFYIRPANLPAATIPGMILLHGGGSNYQAMIPLAYYLAETLGFGSLCLDAPGNNYTSSDGWGSTGPMDTPEFRGNVTGLDGPRGASIYYNVIAALRSITLLQSLPEINPSLVGLGGFSLGGITTLITNGVESKYERLKFVVDFAAPGNWNQEFFETSIWGYYYDLEWGTEKCEIFLEAFDPINYAPFAYAPTLMVCGTNDETFPLMLFKQTFEKLPEPKALSLLAGQGHLVYREAQSLESMLSWCQVIVEEETPYAVPSFDRVDHHSNGTMTIDVYLANEPRIDEVGLIYNFANLDSPTAWLTEKKALQEGKAIYSWTIETQNAEEYAFYPAVFRNGLQIFSGPPVFHNDLQKLSESKSSKLTALELIIAILLINYAAKKKTRQ